VFSVKERLGGLRVAFLLGYRDRVMTPKEWYPSWKQAIMLSLLEWVFGLWTAMYRRTHLFRF
jgi:hypothetical protein